MNLYARKRHVPAITCGCGKIMPPYQTSIKNFAGSRWWANLSCTLCNLKELYKDDLVGFNVHVSFWNLGKAMSEDLYGGGSYQIPWPIK